MLTDAQVNAAVAIAPGDTPMQVYAAVVKAYRDADPSRPYPGTGKGTVDAQTANIVAALQRKVGPAPIGPPIHRLG
jgi:hypothetical protein